ncbi:MAG: NEW3 domain-containing protein [Bacteroidota bacterium]
MIRAITLLVLLLSCLADSQVFYNPNDERFKSLYLEKVQTDYNLQKELFNRQKTLYEKGLISQQEFQQSQATFKHAQITYQQAILALAFEQPHITVDKAIKYRTRDGLNRVRLTLRNTTGGLIAGRNVNVEEFEGVRTDQISNVYVSLLNDQHTIVSQPYEAKIASMPQNRPITVDFSLLQDLEHVTVRCIYGDKSEEKNILLQVDESANKVLITSEQFSQEADLGMRANYDLSLALFSRADNVYKLQVLNLPRQIPYDFIESETNARLSQVKFSQDVNTRKLSLSLYLPDHYDSTSFLIDKPIDFYAVAIPQKLTENFDHQRKYSAAELDKMNVGYVRLELVPRGVGRIQVRATNFYQEIKPDEKVQMTLTVYNDGTRPLDNIKVRASAPLNWFSAVSPEIIQSLPPGKEQIILLTMAPPTDVSVGDYEATIKTESSAGERKVESEEKTIRIHVAAHANIMVTTVLILLLTGLLLGVVAFGIKLSRR